MRRLNCVDQNSSLESARSEDLLLSFVLVVCLSFDVTVLFWMEMITIDISHVG